MTHYLLHIRDVGEPPSRWRRLRYILKAILRVAGLGA
jgi:hypothetical protein